MPLRQSAIALEALILLVVAVLIAPNLAAFPYDAGDGTTATTGYCEADPARACDFDTSTLPPNCGGQPPSGVGPCIFVTGLGYCEQDPLRACDFDTSTPPPNCGGEKKGVGPCVFDSGYASPAELNGYSTLLGDVGPSVVLNVANCVEPDCPTLSPPTITYDPRLRQICMRGLMAISREDKPDEVGIYRMESNGDPNDPFRVDAPDTVCDENGTNCVEPGYGEHGPLGICFYYVNSTEVPEEGDPLCDPETTGGKCTQDRLEFTVNLQTAVEEIRLEKPWLTLNEALSEVARGVLIYDPDYSAAAGLGSTGCNPNYDPKDPDLAVGLPCWIELGFDDFAFFKNTDGLVNESLECIDAFDGETPTAFGFDTKDCDVLKLVEKRAVAPTVDPDTKGDNDPFDLAGTPLVWNRDEAVLREALGLVMNVCNDADPDKNSGNPSCEGEQQVAGRFKAGDQLTFVERPDGFVCVEPDPEDLLIKLAPYTNGTPVTLVACEGNDTIVASQYFSKTAILNTPSDGNGSLQGLNIVAVGDEEYPNTLYFAEVPSRNDAEYDFTDIRLEVVKIVMNQLDDKVLTGDNSVFVDLGNGADKGIGGNGSQTWFGGANDDIMTGGPGPDCFVLHDKQGKDTVTDFRPTGENEGDRLVNTTSTLATDLPIESAGMGSCRVYTRGNSYIEVDQTCEDLLKAFPDRGFIVDDYASVGCPSGTPPSGE